MRMSCSRARSFEPRMKAIVILCFILSYISTSQTGEACGKYNLNGKSTFPWNVGIYEESEDGKLNAVCFGSIIGPNVILTAAHCFCEQISGNPLNKQFYLIPGKTEKNVLLKDKSFNIQKILNTNIHIHEEYSGLLGFFEYDIALVKLDNKLTYGEDISPICIDWGNNNPNIQDGTVGKQVVWDKNYPKAIDFKHIDHDECASECHKLMWQSFLTNDKICTKSDALTLSDNDGGAGLVLKNEDGFWYMRGVFSLQDNVAHKINVYTKISRFLNWLTLTHAKISKKI